MAGLLVATIADLPESVTSRDLGVVEVVVGATHRRHGDDALEASADGIIDTLGLAPGRRDTLETVGLVAPETLGACSVGQSSIRFLLPSILVSRYSGRGEGSGHTLLHDGNVLLCEDHLEELE